MKTEAVSQNNCKVFWSQSWHQRTQYSWSRRNGEDQVQKAIAICMYSTLVKSVFVLESLPQNHLNLLCVSLSYSVARLHQEANVRQLFSVSLCPRIHAHCVCTCQPCMKRSMSRGWVLCPL